MRIPFAFMKGAAAPPPFDPMTLTPSSWLQGSFGGLPWVYTTLPLGTGTPPQETSRSSGACVDPVAGRIVDGVTSARYDSTGGANASTRTDSGSTNTDAFITNGSWSPGSPTDYTIMGLVYVDSAPAHNAGSPYFNPTIMQCDARWGCSFSSGGVGIYYYNGSTFPERQEAWTIGQWNFFCCRFGGALGVHVCQVDVNVTAGTPTDLGSNISQLGIGNTTGNNPLAFNGGISNKFDMLERLTLGRACTDTERDDYYSYLKATYPSAGLP